MFLPLFMGGDHHESHHHTHINLKPLTKSVGKLGENVERAGLDISAGSDTVCAAIYHSRSQCFHCEKDLTSLEDKTDWIYALAKNKQSQLGLGSKYKLPCCGTIISFFHPSLEEQFSHDRYSVNLDDFSPAPTDTWSRFLHFTEWYTIERATIRRSMGTCMNHQPKMKYATPEVLIKFDIVEGWV